MMNGTTTDRETAMNTRHWMTALGSAGLGLCLMAIAPASHAVDNFTAVTASDKPAKTKKPKQSKAPKPPVSPNTSESKAERDKRLLRECRGKANAGACEGFAS